MKFFYLSVCLLLTVLSCFAQKNYQKGYVITLKGDTLNGLINYKEWDRNPIKIDFTSNLDQKPDQFSTVNISKFVVANVMYERHVVSISLGTMDIASLTTVADTSTKVDTVFLKVLQKGDKITLYSYSDDLKYRFYYSEKDTNTPKEFLYRNLLNLSGAIITQNIYRTQMNTLLGKYNNSLSIKVIESLSTMSYKQDDFIKIFSAVNQYTGQNNTKSQKNKTRFFVGGGLNMSSFKINGDNAFNKSNSATSFAPKINIGVDAFANPDVGKLIFRGEISFTMNKFKLETTNNILTSTPISLTEEFSQINVTVTPQIIYNIYNNNALKVMVGGGLSMNLSSYPKNTYTANFQTAATSVNDYYKFNKSWFSLPLKAGVVLHKTIEVYGSYIIPASITDDFSFNGNITTVQMGVNYFFGKRNDNR